VSDFVVITGLSGAGRSQAANDLEDLGWFVIDNLPAGLIPKVAELVLAPGSATPRVALVVGAAIAPDALGPEIVALQASGARVRHLFLEAATDVLVRRYESTRRRHPLLEEGEGLAEAIERERLLLQPLKERADVVVDTTSLNVHDLSARMTELFGEDALDHGMRTRVMSFGYTHGLPTDVDLVIDCRFLPNPHWVDELRPLTGLHEPVRDYVLGQEASQAFLQRLDDLLELLLPAYVAEGKSYLSVAFGCTGGRHRSVAISEAVADLLRARGFHPTVVHRDISR
jgi:UPF0042 nucleotide-binding protein